MRNLAIIAAAAMLAGCNTIPQPALADFDNNKAEVRVAYDLFGPSMVEAREYANPVGREHCRSVGKTTTYISSRMVRWDQYNGEYVFLYRCEGADRVTIE